MKYEGVESFRRVGKKRSEVGSKKCCSHSELFARTVQQSCTVHLLEREPDHVESK